MKSIYTKATSQSHAGMNLATARDAKTTPLYEEIGGIYTLGEDGMYYPNLELLVEEEPHYGKYGRMRMNYIKEHRPGLHTELLFDGKLVSHLNDIDDTARQRMELLTRQIQEQQGVNEELKALDQMGWVGACNIIRNATEEIVLKELIYC